jgi:hypothetical protein
MVVGLSTPAFADSVVCNPRTGVCYTVIDQPGTDPISNPDPSTGFTPGPTVCSYKNADGQNVEVPCSTGDGYWSNGRICYIKISADQPAPPPGGAPTGAWYACTPVPNSCGLRDCYGVTFWSNTPPPGINTLTPSQAAQRLISTFQIQGINIGFAPNPNIPGSKSYVGVPIWMWVKNPTPLTYGPYSDTATLGGVTITATAKVTSILWNMGDGKTVPCGSAGTEFKVAYGAVDSPTCGYRYSTTSHDQPGGTYTITATSQWTVTWTGDGKTGTVPLTSASNSNVEINELQAVNVGN